MVAAPGAGRRNSSQRVLFDSSMPMMAGFSVRGVANSMLPTIGKPGHIVSPLVIEIAIQEDGWKQAEFEWRAGSEPLDDLPRALIFLVGIEAHEVKVQLIGVDLGEEVSPASKVF